MKVIDHQDVYTIELTKTEMEAIYELSTDPGIHSMVKYGKMLQDDPKVEAAVALNKKVEGILYGDE